MISYIDSNNYFILSDEYDSNKEYDLSIILTVYNHVEYVSDAIDNILNQITNYKYELIILDDYSVDGSREKIVEYEKNNKEIIHIILADHNIGIENTELRSGINLYILHNLTRSKYISTCEGDDYWINKSHIDTCLKYLFNNDKCSMVITNAKRIDMNDGNVTMMNTRESGAVSEYDIITRKNIYPPTATMIYKKEIVTCNDNQYLLRLITYDYAIQILALTQGYVYYCDSVDSVYRYEVNDSWSYSTHRNVEKHIRYIVMWNYYLNIFDSITENRYHFEVIAAQQLNSIRVVELMNMNNYFEKISTRYVELYKKMFCNFEIDPALLDYCNKYKYIVIWGIGKYGQVISDCLRTHGISYDGYAVSNLNSEKEFMGMQVWKLDSIPYDKCETGVIVAIAPYDLQDLMESLKKAQITNYHFAIWTDIEKIENIEI